MLKSLASSADSGDKTQNPESSHIQMCLSATIMKMLASVFHVMSHANVELICKQRDNCIAVVSLRSNAPKLRWPRLSELTFDL